MVHAQPEMEDDTDIKVVDRLMPSVNEGRTGMGDFTHAANVALGHWGMKVEVREFEPTCYRDPAANHAPL